MNTCFSVRDDILGYILWSCLFYPAGRDIIKATAFTIILRQYLKTYFLLREIYPMSFKSYVYVGFSLNVTLFV